MHRAHWWAARPCRAERAASWQLQPCWGTCAAVCGGLPEVSAPVGVQPSTDRSERMEKQPCVLDQALLQFLVCPLSNKPVSEAWTNELMNEELGRAYPIPGGVPNMVPQAAWMTRQNRSRKWSSIRSYLKAAHTSQHSEWHLPFTRSAWRGRRVLSLCTDCPCSMGIFSRTAVRGLCGGRLPTRLRQYRQPALAVSCC